MENETHEKIINVLKEKGPSLPIQIAKQIGLSSLFVSAYLSELANEKRIKISHMKVGGSPLYFLEEQRALLEPFHKFLHPKEIEAFLILKNKKVIKDSEQNPAVRVALRSIRDFAVGFKKQDEIYWRYYLIPESEIMALLNSKIIQRDKPETKIQKAKISKPKMELSQEKSPGKPSALKISDEKTKEKEKPKTEFALKIIEFLKNNYKIIEEKEYKPKEYNCIIQINSNLGPIQFLTQAKDKKTISESDLIKLLSNAQSQSLPALMIYTGKIVKKSEQYLEKHSSVLKAKKIE